MIHQREASLGTRVSNGMPAIGAVADPGASGE
jgi:hypothetical protein